MTDRAKLSDQFGGYEVKMAASGNVVEGLSYEQVSEMILADQLSESDWIRRPGGIWQILASATEFRSALEALPTTGRVGDKPSLQARRQDVEPERVTVEEVVESGVPLMGDDDCDPDGRAESVRATEDGESNAKASVQEVLSSISGHVNRFTQTETVGIESVRSLFREIFIRHSSEDIEEHFAVGLPATTPELLDIQLDPKPWVFVRVILFFAVAFALLLFGWIETENPNLLPGLILIGSFAIPVSFTIFFFECNLPKNISLYTLTKLFVWGGILGIIFSLILYEVNLGTATMFGASAAALLEEPGKLAAVLILANATRHHWTLNGICMGAAVGAGFAAFESAGYALQGLLMSAVFVDKMADGDGIDFMLDVMFTRGVLAPFGHVIWTAILVGALWRVKGKEPFGFAMLGRGEFLRPAFLVVALHFLWNSPLPSYLPFAIGYIVLGLIGWVAVLGLMFGGMKQISCAQQAAEMPDDLPEPV